MNSRLFLTAAAFCVASALVPVASAQVNLLIDAAQRGPRISDLQYGIFYEEINNAGDGGLYAELIRNRNFEDASSPDFWSAIGSPTMRIVRDGLMNEARSAALELMLNSASQGISNTGYWGIDCRKDDSYALTLWLKSDKGYKGTVTASLVDENDNIGASATSDFTADGNWQKLVLTLHAEADMPDARFNLTFSNSGTLTLGMVSLMPPTFNDRPNGCRRDLAKMLEDLRPKFVRFPGGCYIEGSGTAEDNRRFEWKKTIGPIEQRPGHFNYNWGYPCTDGLGFHEFLQFTEDIGAEPLFVVNIGIGHGWHWDYTDIDSYIQEALDAIEYCNGDVTTEWGAKRAANGHPEPFNLRLLEIGNENYNFDDELSDHYPDRYKAFYDAIKSRYPEITLIGNVEAWGTDDPSWRNQYPIEMVDEHYYRNPAWFEGRYQKYDSYSRTGPQVYVGEYAVTDGYGKNGHLKAALGEAVYMMGMERNSDIVAMASYAPIFYNEERGGGWLPDMIRFTHKGSFGTPSYYVQKLMPEYLGSQNLKWIEENNLVSSDADKIGLSTWSTVAVYDNIKVSDAAGNIIYQEDFSGDLSGWNVPSSDWRIENGGLMQRNGGKQGEMIYSATSLPSSYTLELEATKVSGAEGFLIGVNVADKDNYIWWNIGGWGNSQHGVQLSKNGSKSDFDIHPGSIESGRKYDVKVCVSGSNVKCYLDGEMIHDVNIPYDRKVYVSSTIDDKEGVMYLKIANTSAEPQQVAVKMANATMASAESVVLTSSDPSDENSSEDPCNVVPVAGEAPVIEGNAASYTAPAYSLSIITVRLSDINYEAPAAHEASVQQQKEAAEALKSVASLLGWMHTDAALPVMTPEGAEIDWSLKSDVSGLILTSNRHSAQISFESVNNSDKTLDAGILTAYVRYPDGATAAIDIKIGIAPADDMYGYLYTYMNSGREVTNYALGSKEGKGKHFEQLADGAEIFDTETLAPIEGGTRDAYLGRGERADEYFMTVTDMCNAKTGSWNNFGIDLLRSTDLIHWDSTSFDFREGKKIFSDADSDTGIYSSDDEYARISRVWAPQFIWDPDAFSGKGAYMVYYSVLSDNAGDVYDRMVYSYADRDFKTLTQPRLLMDPGVSLIDADIVWNEYDHLYHMLVKKTGRSGIDTGIFEFVSSSLTGGEWIEKGKKVTENTSGVEGPTMMRRIDEDVWNVYFMRFDSDYRFKVEDINHDGTSTGFAYGLTGKGNFQHGSVMHVDQDEYTMLQLWSDVVVMLKKAILSKAQSGTAVFDEAISFAEKTLDDNRTVALLLERLPEARAMLVDANGKYLAEKSEGFSDVTHLLINPDFEGNTSAGWRGTSFSAANSGVAEQYSRNYDTYQILKDMPAGTYRLEVQGFYRFGFEAEARKAHNDGSEKLWAKLYINDVETSFMSLFEEVLTAYPNNVWSANNAFNSDRLYDANSVEYTLEETGDLRLGIRKTQMVNGDWNCVDNFRLWYNPDASGVARPESDDTSEKIDVTSPDGKILKKSVAKEDAVSGLSKGLYIIGKTKRIVTGR